MFPALELGPLVIPTGVFALLLGGWLALSVVERAASAWACSMPRW